MDKDNQLLYFCNKTNNNIAINWLFLRYNLYKNPRSIKIHDHIKSTCTFLGFRQYEISKNEDLGETSQNDLTFPRNVGSVLRCKELTRH